MKITVVAHGLSNGGAERVASLVANHLARQGHEVLFIAAFSPDRVYSLDESAKYVYISPKYTHKVTKGLYRSWQIDKEISRYQPDLVLSFIINELIISSIRKKFPIIYSLRNDPGKKLRSKIEKILCFYIYGKASKVIFQTPGARDFFPRKIRDKGVVIANPLTRNLPQWNANGCEKAVITACRLTEQKNLPLLISAFAAFHETHQDYSLKIYGDGKLLDSLKNYAECCGVADSVCFPGYAKNIHEIMANSAIFALTSNYEGLSNSMLEALAIGVPTVCTDCPSGGAALYIKDSVNGMLVPVGDSEELGKRFCQMADDKALCLKMSENSKNIREALDVDKVLKQWEAVLN